MTEPRPAPRDLPGSPRVPFAEAFRFWVWLGFVNFGGPTGQISLMHTELVERRRTVTARSVDRLIKVARTVADLMSQDDIDAGCLLEAAGFRDVDPLADLPSEIAQLA